MGAADSNKGLDRPYYQGMVVATAAFSGFSNAQAPGMAGYVIPQITNGKDSIYVDRGTASWVASIIFFGVSIGSLWAGVQSAKIGRKKSLLIGLFLMLTGNIVIGFSQSFALLMVGRVLNGLAAGSLMVDVPNYCAEITQTPMRPISSAFQMLMNTSGISMAYVIGAILPWRMTVLTFAGLIGMNIVGVWFICPESHIWLMLKNREEEARESLKSLRGDSKVADIEIEKIKENQRNASASKSLDKHNKKSFLYKCRSLSKDKTFRLPFLSCLMLRVLGLDWSGFFIMGSYLVTIVDQADIPMDAFKVAAILSFTRIPLAILTLFYISKVKIKTIYIATSTTLSIGAWMVVVRLYLGHEYSLSLFGETIGSWMTLAGMVILYTGYSLGMAQVCFIMPSELLPSKRRAAGIGLLNFTNGITTFLALKIFPYLIQPAGDIVPFAIFGTASVLSAVLLWKFVPETRGKSLQDIERYYRVKSGLETTLFFANMMGQMLDIKHANKDTEKPIEGLEPNICESNFSDSDSELEKSPRRSSSTTQL